MTTLVAGLLGAWIGPANAAPPESVRYDLRIGDHLVYRQEVHRNAESPTSRFETRLRTTTHVLVTGEVGGSLRVGTQRNRISAELLRYEEDGRNRTESERPRFAERIAKSPAATVEGNWYLTTGAALLPTSVLRESRSELLPHVRELPPLPPLALAPGASWPSPGALGLAYRMADQETIGGASCRRFDGQDDAKSVRTSLWFCEATGTVDRVVWDGSYGTPPNTQVRETVRIERVERRRGEDVRAWLRDPETREGALAALLVSEVLPVEPAVLHPLLDAADPWVARRALAVLFRHHLPPPRESIAGLVGSRDAPLRALAVRSLNEAPEASARPLLERARADDDPFVAAAARAGLARFEAPPAPALVETAALVQNSRAVGEGGASWPRWDCTATTRWPEEALRLQRRPGQPPGGTLRVTSSAAAGPRPYVMYVPDDYRGDEPFPLLIVLGGGPGKAIPTAQGLRESLESQGYLALVPHAGGLWWDKRPRDAFRALLAEVFASFNVDPNRVYLTGFSNGGTGTFLYATLLRQRFAAAASLMGGGLPFFGPEPPAAVNVAALPFLFVHGDKDEIIPVRASRDTVKDIKSLDPEAPVVSHILAGRGHDVVIGADDGLTLPFLADKRREPFPKHLRFATRSLEFGREFWLEVQAKDGGMAETQAEIGPDNVIDVTTKRVVRMRLLLRRELVPGTSPVVVRWNGEEAFRGPFVEDCVLLARSWREAGDPFLAHSLEVTLDRHAKGQ